MKASCPDAISSLLLLFRPLGPMKGFMDRDINSTTAERAQEALAEIFKKFGPNNVPGPVGNANEGIVKELQPTPVGLEDSASGDPTAAGNSSENSFGNIDKLLDPKSKAEDVSDLLHTMSLSSQCDYTREEKHSEERSTQEQGGEASHSKPPLEASSKDLLSIFDSTSEYIITGNELADQTICLSTHSMHILTRPTIISDSRYERNSLLFSVGFVLRRAEDPRPFRPLLSNLASTLCSMEVESQFLSNERTRPKLQRALEGILISLNSKRAECNLLLDDANALNLRLFRPPKPPAPPVPDYVVPILLRPEWQLQVCMSWDLTINWIIPHINGLKYTRLISQSSEVDMEMVRACLRVLKHHGVLAFVDIFCYGNIYECTPLASAMMAGRHPKLLNAAIQFIFKGPPSSGRDMSGSVASTCNLDISNHSSAYPRDQHYSRTATRENPNTPLSGPTAHAEDCRTQGVGADASQYQSTSSLGRYLEPRPAMLSVPPQIIPPSSFPSQVGDFINLADRAGVHVTERKSPAASSPSPTPGRGPGLDLNSTSLRRESLSMKAALAEMYCSCRRGITFGDILVDKLTRSGELKDEILEMSDSDIGEGRGFSGGRTFPSASPSRSLGRVENSLGRNRGRRREGSDSSEDTGVGGYGVDREGGESTPTCERRRGTGFKRHGRNSLAIDWKAAFEYFDHRRFVTFGVIFGLIQRIHCYPLAYDLEDGEGISPMMNDNGPPEEEGLSVDKPPMPSMASHRVFADEQQLQQKQQHNIVYSSPHLHSEQMPPSSPSPLTPHHTAMPPLSLSAAELQRRKQEKNHKLAAKVATSMDGTRCDDEVCCMYQLSMTELVDLVSSIGKGVIVIHSMCHHPL